MIQAMLILIIRAVIWCHMQASPIKQHLGSLVLGNITNIAQRFPPPILTTFL